MSPMNRSPSSDVCLTTLCNPVRREPEVLDVKSLNPKVGTACSC